MAVSEASRPNNDPALEGDDPSNGSLNKVDPNAAQGLEKGEPGSMSFSTGSDSESDPQVTGFHNPDEASGSSLGLSDPGHHTASPTLGANANGGIRPLSSTAMLFTPKADPADMRNTAVASSPVSSVEPPATDSSLPPGLLFAAIFLPIFIVGLFVAGVILLLYRRRKRRNQESRELKDLPGGSPISPQPPFIPQSASFNPPLVIGSNVEYYSGIPASAAAANTNRSARPRRPTATTRAPSSDPPPPYKPPPGQTSPIRRVPVGRPLLSQNNLATHNDVGPSSPSPFASPEDAEHDNNNNNNDDNGDAVSDISDHERQRIGARELDEVSVVSDVSADVGGSRPVTPHSPI
ncbi:MAG: hypothetical protein M1833_002056 [Piccolia ochrophora]|nr:MAG: hypothetical protein M1833_002056 [Piccolia ochrophora]